ncbi:hypothetical protein OH77DRAFT_1433274 [Trametes cingulata]|nr:hypothetical protein OH77DRAFT_1433274 [Trametes cingulata]
MAESIAFSASLVITVTSLTFTVPDGASISPPPPSTTRSISVDSTFTFITAPTSTLSTPLSTSTKSAPLPTSSSGSSSSSTSSSSGSSRLTIVLASVGGVLGLLALVLACLFWRCRKNKMRRLLEAAKPDVDSVSTGEYVAHRPTLPTGQQDAFAPASRVGASTGPSSDFPYAPQRKEPVYEHAPRKPRIRREHDAGRVQLLPSDVEDDAATTITLPPAYEDLPPQERPPIPSLPQKMQPLR